MWIRCSRRSWAVTRIFRPADGQDPEVDVVITRGHDNSPYITTDVLRAFLDLPPEECQKKLAERINEVDPDIISLEDWLKKHGSIDQAAADSEPMPKEGV